MNECVPLESQSVSCETGIAYAHFSCIICYSCVLLATGMILYAAAIFHRLRVSGRDMIAKLCEAALA